MAFLALVPSASVLSPALKKSNPEKGVMFQKGLGGERKGKAK